MNTSTLPKPNYERRLETSDALNSDIITAIEKNYKIGLEQTKEFARQFDADSRRESAKKIWDFLKYHITYVKDDESGQMIKLPSRFISDGTGDCKSYSLTAASLLGNLGIPVSFRYASYKNSQTPTHVYTVAKDEDGNNIIVDGVWKSFDSEKAPVYKFDHPMNVYTLSGTDDIGRAKRKKKKRGGFFRKLGKGLKKIGLAIPRRAFRTLVALNVRGMATKMARAIKKNPNPLKNTWEKVGGKFSELQKSINRGAKRKRILGINDDLGQLSSNRQEFKEKIRAAQKRGDKQEVRRLLKLLKYRIFHGRKFGIRDDIGIAAAMEGGDNDGIGIAPAALLASAAPIIIAILKTLKGQGADADIPEGSPEPPLNRILEATTAAAQAYFPSSGGGGGSYDAGSSEAALVDPTDPDNPNADKIDVEADKDDEPGGGFEIKPIYLIGGAAAVWFFFLRKK